MAPGLVGTPDKEEEEKKAQSTVAAPGKPWPKGVVLGPDGKPCRTCTDVSSLFAMTKSTSKTPTATATSSSAPTTTSLPSDCPPDVTALGRSSWTLLHSITATYPASPTPTLQRETATFLHTFSKLYPCWHCAADFQTYLKEHEPRVSNRDEFGRWMCEAHNAVNEKLGKERFDCGRWEERWRTGWRDGSCDL